MKRKITAPIIILLTLILLSTSGYTQSHRRNIAAWFNNIQVELDGKTLELSSEPFIFQNKVYMPIEELADHLFINFHYKDREGIVQLNTNRLFEVDVDTSSIPIAFQRNFELESLRRQVQQLQEEIQRMEGVTFPFQRITSTIDMERYLRQHFRSIGDLDVDLRFTKLSGDNYTLNVAFGTALNKWQSLDRRTIENWVDDILHVVTRLYNSNATISGSIRNNHVSTGITYVSYQTRGNRLYFDFRLAEHRKSQEVDGERLATQLDRTLRNFGGEVFKYEVFVQGSDVDLLISTDRRRFSQWTPALKMQYLRRLRTEIQRVNTNIAISGRVLDSSNGESFFRFSINEEGIRSLDLLLEVEAHLNRHHRNFHFGAPFVFKYTIYEGFNNSFEVIVEGDFLDSDGNWQRVKEHGELSLRMHLQTALRYVDQLFDVDIFGELKDRNLRNISSLEYYRTTENHQRQLMPLIFP